MNTMEDLAGIDRSYRCIMKKPSNRYVLRSEHLFMAFYSIGSAMSGIGATRSASAMRRAGFKCVAYPLGIVWGNFSKP